MRKYINMIVLAIVVAGLSGCSHLNKWVAIRDGVEFVGDSVVRVEGVVFTVREFGVENGWGSPELQLTIDNQSGHDIMFRASECRMDIGGELVSPARMNSVRDYRLKGGEQAQVRIGFNGRLRLVPDGPHNRRESRVWPEELVLYLAPLAMGAEEYVLPALYFRNPNPLSRR